MRRRYREPRGQYDSGILTSESSLSLEAKVLISAGVLPRVLVNGRFRAHQTTGIGRYANELISRLEKKLEVLEPRTPLKGAPGHLWEQCALPARVGSGLLWSPCGTGPVWISRQVVTVHDMFPFDNPEWFSKSFTRGFQAITLPLIRRARKVIAVSEFTKRRLIEISGVGESKVVVVHSGVGAQFSPQSEEAVRAARQAVGLEGRPYLLSVSSLEPRKNVRRLVEAWRRALPQLPNNLWLVLAGATGSSTVFQSVELSVAPERLLMPGYVPERYLPGLYAGARALLYPSLAEGFGLPVLEAMACGVPVLTSANSSLLEVAGGAALLVDPADTDSIARSIVMLAIDDHLCLHLRERGLRQAAHFSWDEAASRTWRSLEAVTNPEAVTESLRS